MTTTGHGWSRVAAVATTALLGALGSGCSDEIEPAPDVIAPDFPEGAGQVRQPDANLPYAPGPYGDDIGSVLPNYGFYGWVRPVDDFDQGFVAHIQLAEFYNPTGDGTYPEGSVFPVGGAKPKALVIDLSAVWCPYCKTESDDVLPGRYADDKARGGEYMVNLAEGNEGEPTTYQELEAWAVRYDLEFPLVLDPDYRLATFVDSMAWPTNLIVDTRTMKLVEAVSGEPDDDFWATFESVMDGTHEQP
jgi:hypothetical protein